MIAIIVVRSSLYQLVLYNTAQHPSSTHYYIFRKLYKYVLGCSSMWHWFIGAMQVNATLLAVSLVSLAKSQCGKVGGKKDEEQTEQYLEVGKWVTVGNALSAIILHTLDNFRNWLTWHQILLYYIYISTISKTCNTCSVMALMYRSCNGHWRWVATLLSLRAIITTVVSH